MSWCDLVDGGVLELLAPLDLHCRSVEGRTVAWWLDDRGRWLAVARVGLA
jgi:hypothetical protein